MNTIGTKVLKFLLLIGITIYLFTTFETDATAFNRFLYSLFIGGLAYLAASLFGFTLLISQNYLIAFIITATLLVVIPLSLAKFQSTHSWFSDELSVVLLCGIMILNIVSDIRHIIVSLQINDTNQQNI